MSKYRRKGTTTRTLTDTQVINFRRAYQAGEMTSREIMIAAGFSMGSTRRMLSGETYQHLETEQPGAAAPEVIQESAERLMAELAAGNIGPQVGAAEKHVVQKPAKPAGYDEMSEAAKARLKAMGIVTEDEPPVPPGNPLDE